MASDDLPDDPPFEEEDEEERAPEPVNAASKASTTRIRNRAKRGRAEAAAFWTTAFSSPVGRRELWGILEAAGTFRQRFANGPNGFPQPEASWVYAGEKDMGMRLYLSWLALCPDGVAQMLREHHPQLRPAPRARRRTR